MKEIVIVRSGGDLATGTIQKLHRSGMNVLVLETEKPNFIRRKVCYGACIYEGEIELEGESSKFIGNIKNISENIEEFLEDLEKVYRDKKIPVIIDSNMKILEILEKNAERYKVIALVDAVIAKRNLGVTKDKAPIVIALGPGFYAGKDADVVIETMRGHDLGKLIFSGEALPNTGVPGMIGGESKLRVVYSDFSGKLTIVKDIGEIVKKGEVIAKVGEDEILATIDGLIRGMITDGHLVEKGLKIADIDPRLEEYKNCFTISDKARALGGAALEALLYMRIKKNV